MTNAPCYCEQPGVILRSKCERSAWSGISRMSRDPAWMIAALPTAGKRAIRAPPFQLLQDRGPVRGIPAGSSEIRRRAASRSRRRSRRSAQARDVADTAPSPAHAASSTRRRHQLLPARGDRVRPIRASKVASRPSRPRCNNCRWLGSIG